MRVLLLALCLVIFAPVRADSPPVASATTLHALFASEWERGLRENPLSASMRGDRRWNDQWGDSSLAAIKARQQADRDALATLRAIDRASLAETDQLSYDMFAWQRPRPSRTWSTRLIVTSPGRARHWPTRLAS